MKEIKQDAAVPRGSLHADRSTVDRRSNDYVTAFHLAGRPPVQDSQPCITGMDNWLCSLLNACYLVTITHRHSDTTDSPMCSLAPILPMSDIRCANRPNSSKK